MERKPFFKRIGQRFLAMGLHLALVLGGMEIFMRSQGKIPRQRNPLRGFHVSHKNLGWLGVPGYKARFIQPDFDVVIAHDEMGFRMGSHGVDLLELDAPRFAVLGDSFTWGWGVPQGAVFTDHLQKAAAKNASVRNFGVNAYGTGQQLALLREVVAPWNPDHVLLMVFGNDFNDNVDEKGGKRPFFAMQNGKLVAHNSPVRRKIAGPSRSVSRSSVAISYLHYHVNEGIAHLREGNHAQASDGEDAGSELLEVDAMQAEVFAALLAEMQSTCGGLTHPCDLMVAYIPERHEVVAGRCDARRDLVRETCDQLGLPFLDLTGGLHQAWLAHPDKSERGLPLYLPHDMHWAPEGHRAAAQVLRQGLDLP